jgi:hypothetical protein
MVGRMIRPKGLQLFWVEPAFRVCDGAMGTCFQDLTLVEDYQRSPREICQHCRETLRRQKGPTMDSGRFGY